MSGGAAAARRILEAADTDTAACDDSPLVCTDHPGRENHCVTGWCGACWRCAAAGVDARHATAYMAGWRRREADVDELRAALDRLVTDVARLTGLTEEVVRVRSGHPGAR